MVINFEDAACLNSILKKLGFRHLKKIDFEGSDGFSDSYSWKNKDKELVRRKYPDIKKYCIKGQEYYLNNEELKIRLEYGHFLIISHLLYYSCNEESDNRNIRILGGLNREIPLYPPISDGPNIPIELFTTYLIEDTFINPDIVRDKDYLKRNGYIFF